MQMHTLPLEQVILVNLLIACSIRLQRERIQSRFTRSYQRNAARWKVCSIRSHFLTIRPDATCMQSLEVWTGTTYALAAAMLQQGIFSSHCKVNIQGLTEEAFDTAKGIIITTYYTLGYHFQTPEAWDSKGHFR